MPVPKPPITVIGAGIAGCEAAWQAAWLGLNVDLFEMKPEVFSPAHKSHKLAELVCSNSLKSDNIEKASGLLKEEIRRLGSLIIKTAYENRVPAGTALAVDRESFSASVTEAIEANPKISLVRKEAKEIPCDRVVIIATGPLTSDSLAGTLKNLTGSEYLYFHDAVSPIIHAESINMEKAFRASRYDKGPADYINCPMDRQTYFGFIEELKKGEKTVLKEFEKATPYEGCMPVEMLAERGDETLAFGPMKPVGLLDPRTGRDSYAVVQLRAENREATLYNMVGFQTSLKWGEQKRIFRMIPGLENAEFARFGTIHRNTYIHSPLLLLKTLQLKSRHDIFFAGQITGAEGYVEAAATGFYAGIQAALFVKGKKNTVVPKTTMLGGLIFHITDPFLSEFKPMGANFGLLEPLKQKARKKERPGLYAERALNDIDEWGKSF